MKPLTEKKFITQYNVWLEELNSEEKGQEIIRSKSKKELIEFFKRCTGFDCKTKFE